MLEPSVLIPITTTEFGSTITLIELSTIIKPTTAKAMINSNSSGSKSSLMDHLKSSPWVEAFTYLTDTHQIRMFSAVMPMKMTMTFASSLLWKHKVSTEFKPKLQADMHEWKITILSPLKATSKTSCPFTP